MGNVSCYYIDDVNAHVILDMRAHAKGGRERSWGEDMAVIGVSKACKLYPVVRISFLTSASKLATRVAGSVFFPVPFLPCVGEPGIAFSTWKKMF